MREQTPTLEKSARAFLERYASHPNYIPPVGGHLHAKSWRQEAPLRMLLNNLSQEIAEEPEELIVYGGTGKAARDPEAVQAIIEALLTMSDNESLLIQSGKPVGIVRSHRQAPSVLIANSNIVPKWANWKEFHRLEALGLTMFGQMTAGSWIYIGSQGILQGTYETFAEAAERSFGGTLAGTLTVTGGLGGMGGAQPLAVTLNGGVILAADIDPARIEKRLQSRYIDKMTSNYEEAKAWALKAKEEKKPLSIGLVSDVGEMLRKLLKDNIIPDLATDQTSAHDPLNGYIPSHLSLDEAEKLRKEDPETYRERSLESMAKHVGALLKMQQAGTVVFDYGNNLRNYAVQGGEKDAYNIPGFVPEYIRPLFCEGKGPFRWVTLSGIPEEIRKTDEALIELFPENKRLHSWLKKAGEKVSFQGLPARICWLGLGEREKAGVRFNEMVQDGTLSAPIVIGRDHLDAGSVASPYRETEGMKDGSDAISDWPLLNLMANGAGGATWISFHHGGGVGMGYSQHAGVVIVADGSKAQEACIRRVLHNDPVLGVLRHADAGYEIAVDSAKKHGLWPYSTR